MISLDPIIRTLCVQHSIQCKMYIRLYIPSVIKVMLLQRMLKQNMLLSVKHFFVSLPIGGCKVLPLQQAQQILSSISITGQACEKDLYEKRHGETWICHMY